MSCRTTLNLDLSDVFPTVLPGYGLREKYQTGRILLIIPYQKYYSQQDLSLLTLTLITGPRVVARFHTVSTPLLQHCSLWSHKALPTTKGELGIQLHLLEWRVSYINYSEFLKFFCQGDVALLLPYIYFYLFIHLLV